MSQFDRFVEFSRIGLGRARAAWLRTRGASIRPKCTIGPRVRVDHPRGISVGARATLEEGVWFKLVQATARLNVGDYTFIGRGCEFDVSHELTIGHHVLFGPNVFITDHNHNFEGGALIMDQGCAATPVHIGDDVWIGTGAVILPGVNIGNGAVIGAGAIVTRDIPENTISAGVPATVIRKRGG